MEDSALINKLRWRSKQRLTWASLPIGKTRYNQGGAREDCPPPRASGLRCSAPRNAARKGPASSAATHLLAIGRAPPRLQIEMEVIAVGRIGGRTEHCCEKPARSVVNFFEERHFGGLGDIGDGFGPP